MDTTASNSIVNTLTYVDIVELDSKRAKPCINGEFGSCYIVAEFQVLFESGACRVERVADVNVFADESGAREYAMRMTGLCDDYESALKHTYAVRYHALDNAFFTVTARPYTMYKVDGDIRDDPDNRDPEMVTDGPDFSSEFKTFSQALGVAREWARDNPAHVEGNALVHHKVEVMAWLAEDDETGYVAKAFDTATAADMG